MRACSLLFVESPAGEDDFDNLLILADEPTAPLDSARAHIVMDLLARIAKDQEAAVLVVTHDESIFQRFDRLISLRDGRIVAAEGARAVMAEP